MNKVELCKDAQAEVKHDSNNGVEHGPGGKDGERGPMLRLRAGTNMNAEPEPMGRMVDADI